jgi:DNA processing protein
VLLRAGASLVTRADEVVELVGHVGELAADAERPSSLLDGLADNELRVYDALPARGARTTDEIAVASGLPPTQVLGPLSMLEIAGLVVCQGGRWKLALR